MVLKNAFAGLASEDDIEELAVLLAAIRDRLAFVEPTTASNRAYITNTPNVSVTNTPAIGTVSNQSQTGGLYTNADQYVQFQIAYQNIRNRITVT